MRMHCSVRWAAAFVTLFVAGACFIFSGLLLATQPPPAPRDTPQGELNTAVARVIYPNRIDPHGLRDLSIQAQLEPGPFTIPKGYVVTKLKYHFSDPKTGFEHDKITATTIYSVTEGRYIREAKNNPDIILPTGEYKVVCGGLPEAVGVLTYSLIRSDFVAPPIDIEQPPGKDSHRQGIKQPPEDTRITGDKPKQQGGGATATTSYDWLYQPVHLPQPYLPKGYHYYPEDPIPSGDPPIGKGSQTLWHGIPLHRKQGQPSSSAGEHPYSVYFDGIIVYKTLAGAKQLYHLSAEGAKDRLDVDFGDEAYVDFKGDDGSMFTEYRSSKTGEIFRRDLNIRNIRVGRTIFGLRLVGSKVEDFLRQGGQDGKTFVAHPTPSREELTKIAELYVTRVRDYARTKGWLNDDK